jgi:uncharacterized protein
MLRQKSVFKVLSRTGPLIALAVVIALGIAAPASAQFFNFGGWTRSAPRGNGGWFGNFFRPFQPRPQQPRRIYHDYSRAPLPTKRDTAPESTILVLGDGMADWLAYGLEQAYADEPEIGIVRKVKANTGLIRYQFKGDPADWPAAAKEILANEKPDVIVVMLGLSDRIPIREPAEKKEKKNARSKSDAKSSEKTLHSDDKGADNGDDNGLSPDDTDNAEAARDKTQRPANGIDPFHDERWIEFYNKKIEAMIAAVKSKGVPVVWVGLPAIRGVKGTADMLFLDSLYRDAADKAGISYVDDWDGFVDDAGRFMLKGPDFQGQTRLLRSWDGVYFTTYGARKLALYVEHEIDRLMAARSAPFALPNEQATPEANAVPGQPAPRPLAGPILPLVASSFDTNELLGGPGSTPAPVSALAAKTLVEGEPLKPPAGRADDLVWPRREVKLEPAISNAAIASRSPPATGPGPSSRPPTLPGPAAAVPRTPSRPRTALRSNVPLRPKTTQPAQFHWPHWRNFFGFRFGAPPSRP